MWLVSLWLAYPFINGVCSLSCLNKHVRLHLGRCSRMEMMYGQVVYPFSCVRQWIGFSQVCYIKANMIYKGSICFLQDFLTSMTLEFHSLSFTLGLTLSSDSSLTLLAIALVFSLTRDISSVGINNQLICALVGLMQGISCGEMSKRLALAWRRPISVIFSLVRTISSRN